MSALSTFAASIVAVCIGSGVAMAVPAHLALTPCATGEPKGTLCGTVSVPEDWSRQNGRHIALHIAVAPAVKPDRQALPLFDIEGGPGIAASSAAQIYLTDLAVYRQHRPVVMVDQRGTGASHPLHCPVIERADPLSDFDIRAVAAACRRTLETDSDLAQYGSVAAARDLDAVRAALGAPQIDISALSYGTALSQVYMRLFPSRVHAAVFIGALPLGEKLPLHHAANAEAVLERVFADCRADARCVRAFPRLEEEWRALLARLDTGAVRIPYAGGAVALSRGPFAEALRGMMNVPQGQRSLPFLIHAAANGDFAPYLAAVMHAGPEPEAEGLYLSVACPEDTNRIAEAEIGPASAGTFLGDWRVRLQQRECSGWVALAAATAAITPLSSKIPVLMFADGHDATTTPRWAHEMAARMPNARVVDVDALTHFPAGLSDMGCLDRIMVAFFAHPSAKDLDTACVAGMKPPPFPLAAR